MAFIDLIQDNFFQVFRSREKSVLFVIICESKYKHFKS